MKSVLFLFTLLLSLPAAAEYRNYGEVSLNGLSRNHSWQLQTPGVTYSMVCNVNGPDGFLSVRRCTGTNCQIERNLKRLAILEVDTNNRYGNWVYVRTAFRTHSEDGYELARTQDLHVSGWAHDGYLCDYSF